MPRLALALIALALPAFAASNPRNGPYELQLLVDGQPARSFPSNGDTWVLGQLGQRYTLRVLNHSPQRVEAVVSVDGRDVIDGQPGNTAKRGYLVPAYGSVDIDGWRISEREAAAFRFSSVPNSYAARMGNGRDVGVIGVAVFAEYRPVLRHYQQPYDRSGAPSSAPPNVPLSEAPMSKSAESLRADSARDRAGLGTEYGEAVVSQVSEVPFQRASSSPCAMLSVRYNDRAGLVAMGIDVDRYDEVVVRRTAEPFPVVDRSFAPPPPGWSR
jgi:hypothetical protein